MKQKYRIMSIVHSGTKGDRGTLVTEDKYKGLVGCKVLFDPVNIHLGYGLSMTIPPLEHKLYDWWTISCIQNVEHDDEDGVLVIETLNSIYYLEELGE